MRTVVERLRHVNTITYYSKPDNIFADFRPPAYSVCLPALGPLLSRTGA